MSYTVLPVTAAHQLFAQVVNLFDDYRGHFGANPAPDATDWWLRQQLTWDRMRVFAAVAGDKVSGIATVAVLPASLTLRTVWMVHDLYTNPGHRRSGIARALLAHLTEAARDEGANTISLQLDAGNTAAQELYLSYGFEPVTDVTTLSRRI
ncbi:MAG TPA: GNAT family N-acetyltransferase [Actinoplanes sp.]|nr:GNAT family N-acetyltransferase [Actinoplanes sp.]